MGDLSGQSALFVGGGSRMKLASARLFPALARR
jgi:hypothetical protein